MIDISIHGGPFAGNTNKNFGDVFRVFSQLVAPTSPRENDIWIVRDSTAIGTVYISDSVGNPNLILRANDVVLVPNSLDNFMLNIQLKSNVDIKTVISKGSSPWGASKGDSLKFGEIYKAYVMEGLTGAIPVSSFVYRNSSWKEITIPNSVLYKNGMGAENMRAGYLSSGTFRKDPENLYLYAYHGTAFAYANAVTNNLYDLTPYTTLKADVTLDLNYSGMAYLGVLSATKQTVPLKTNATSLVQDSASTVPVLTRKTMSMDVSNLNGSYYPAVEAYDGSGSGTSNSTKATILVHRIWLE